MIGLAIFIVILLLVGSVYDWKYRSLPIWILVIGGLGGLAGVLITLVSTEKSGTEVWVALLPGTMALLLAYATREQIGYGDGVLLLVMGSCLGVSGVVIALLVALAGTCVVSIMLLVFRKVSRSSRIPFVPFLCMGSVATLLGGGWSG